MVEDFCCEKICFGDLFLLHVFARHQTFRHFLGELLRAFSDGFVNLSVRRSKLGYFAFAIFEEIGSRYGFGILSI